MKPKATQEQMEMAVEVWEAIKDFPDDDIAVILQGCIYLFGHKLAKEMEAKNELERTARIRGRRRGARRDG